MKSYFIRHTKKMSGVSDKVIQELFDQDRIAVHFPGNGARDSESIEPNDYKERGARTAFKCFKELNENGGYIWAEYRTSDKVKIGRVEPKSFRLYRTEWAVSTTIRRKRKVGDPAVLKTLQMRDVRTLEPREALRRGHARPQQGTVARWKAIRNKLESLVNNVPFDKEWDDLGTEKQETVCSEYLRNPDVKQCPRLEFLLLPIGRTLKHVDIYGLLEDGNELLAQVTYYEKDGKECKQKIEYLRKYQGKGVKLVFFCRCREVSEEEDILFIPIERVFEWLKKHRAYFKKVSS